MVKLIRTSRLIRRQTQTLHCEIDLCQLPGDSETCLVNVRQGRTGATWLDSTATPQALPRAAAEALFEQTLASRRAQGFSDDDGNAATIPLLAPAPPSGANAAADALLLARLPPAAWARLTEAQRTRTIWRIGERRLAAAVPRLVELIEQGGAMHDYCLAWAIGRCGDQGAAAAMQTLSTRAGSDAARRIALLAYLLLADAAQRQRHAASLVADWPASLRAAWQQQDEEAAARAIADNATWKLLSLADWLDQLDQAAQGDPFARRVLLAQLRILPLRAGTFRALRHIYKAAEMRDDGAMFGLLQQRFETSPASAASGGWIRIERAFIRFSEEAARPDSRVAYGTLTRDYLRRRGWRTLRRLGQDGDAADVTLAAGVVQAMDDGDAGQARQRGARRYGLYSHWMVFNRLLRAHGPWQSNRSGRSWFLPAGADAATTSRTEAFPALWDKRPDALLALLLDSRCAGVQTFAARALADNGAYHAAIDDATLRRLLRSPYPDTARFAFALCRQRLDNDDGWLLPLLQSGLAEARLHALEHISRAPARYGADAVLVTTLLCAPEAELRQHGRILCQVGLALPGQADNIARHLLDWLEQCAGLDDIEARLAALAPDLVWLLDNPLRAAAAQAPYARLLALLDHALDEVCALAGAWLTRHAMPLSALPPGTLAHLLAHADAARRRVGAALFGALPDHVLYAQPQLFAALCSDPDPALRRQLEATLARLAPANPAWCAALLPALLDCLFRAETATGLHADLLRQLQGPLVPALATLDRATLLRLLSARSKGAQQLGALLLPRFAAADFSVAEWALLGRNENASVRHWATQAYEAQPQRARAEMEQALRLFDSRWPDSRAFACQFFAQRCESGDWSPALLINLCDHLDPAVQRFGRSMLGSHFDVADVTEYMLKLSQHPSAGMQLFVSGWLESAAAGNPAQLTRLEPYFLSVLSQVNRGRIVKNRVLDFLRRQAESSEAIAAFVARLFARQVLTVAIADKALYIAALRAIEARYPALPATLHIEPPRPHPPTRHTT